MSLNVRLLCEAKYPNKCRIPLCDHKITQKSTIFLDVYTSDVYNFNSLCSVILLNYGTYRYETGKDQSMS